MGLFSTSMMDYNISSATTTSENNNCSSSSSSSDDNGNNNNHNNSSGCNDEDGIGVGRGVAAGGFGVDDDEETSSLSTIGENEENGELVVANNNNNNDAATTNTAQGSGQRSNHDFVLSSSSAAAATAVGTTTTTMASSTGFDNNNVGGGSTRELEILSQQQHDDMMMMEDAIFPSYSSSSGTTDQLEAVAATTTFEDLLQQQQEVNQHRQNNPDYVFSSDNNSNNMMMMMTMPSSYRSPNHSYLDTEESETESSSVSAAAVWNNNTSSRPQSTISSHAGGMDDSISSSSLMSSSQQQQQVEFQPHPYDNNNTNNTTIPCPSETESLIAKQMAELSMKDREEVYFDIHGVSKAIDEECEPNFVNRKIAEMQQSLQEQLLQASKSTTTTLMMNLQNINKKKNADESTKAYRIALEKSSNYVNDTNLLLRFLRATRFNPRDAAKSYLSFYQLKLDLFGLSKITKHITQDDLGDDCLEALIAGHSQLLPQRDNAGRAVWIWFGTNQVQAISEQTLMRRYYYNAMLLSDDVETQRNGVVGIAYMLFDSTKAQHTPRSGSRISTIWKFSQLFKSLPLKVNSLHFCYNEHSWLPRFSILQLVADTFLRLRFRAHHGSRSECIYELQTYGIPANTIPVDEKTGQVMTDGHKEFLRKRYLQEQQWNQQSGHDDDDGDDTKEAAAGDGIVESSIDPKQTSSNKKKKNPPKKKKTPKQNNKNSSAEQAASSVSSSSRSIISVPSRSDVLLGRGKGYFTHVGNVRYRAMIEELKGRYDVASKEMKHQITKEVVGVVQKAGGRFLKDDGAGWIVVVTETARLKVSHSFRSARKAAATEKAKASTTGNNVTTATKSNMNQIRSVSGDFTMMATTDSQHQYHHHHHHPPGKRMKSG